MGNAVPAARLRAPELIIGSMLDGPTSKAELEGAVLTGWRKKRRPQPWARVLEPVTTGIEGDNQGAPETAEGGPTSGRAP